jgi:hypothetical protein
LTADSQRIIAELRGEVDSSHDNSVDVNGGVTGEELIDWETVPEDLDDGETFAHAVRDIFTRR